MVAVGRRDVRRWLFRTAKRVGPGLYVELGCFKGQSAVKIAQGIRNWGVNAHLITVDAFDGTALNPKHAGTYSIESVKQSFEDEEVSDLITPVKGKTAEVARDFKHCEFDFLFIDADHSYEGCKADFEAWSPLVRSGGEIAFHDNNLPGVHRVLEEIPWESYRIENLTVFIKP
jgi:predicted O-methyltransferase YrrM